MIPGLKHYAWSSSITRYTLGHGNVVGEYSPGGRWGRGQFREEGWRPYRNRTDFEEYLVRRLIGEGKDL